jgi:hypothetical protein
MLAPQMLENDEPAAARIWARCDVIVNGGKAGASDRTSRKRIDVVDVNASPPSRNHLSASKATHSPI